jgi:hypothetical protein
MKDDFFDMFKVSSSGNLCEKMLMEAADTLSPLKESIFHKYRYDALGYFKDVLKAKYLSEAQIKVLQLVSTPANENWHRKLALGASISYGKSYLGGGLTNWYFDSWGPSIVATTAPSQQSVVDLLWKEVRIQRDRADTKWGIGSQDFIGPQAPAMKRAPDWWAKGYVASKGENFKGRHVDNMMFVFDEAVGLSEMYFRMTKGMFKPNTSHLWIALYNPTDTSSAMYQEICRPDSDWEVIELSALTHPNILASLRGEPEPIPAAVSLEQVMNGIKEECEPIHVSEKTATDFEFPPDSGKWYKPGSVFQGDFMGRWPSSDESAIWSDSLWKAITVPLKWEDVRIAAEEIPRIGCDVAYLGSAKTSIHVSWGDYSVHQEHKGGQNPMRTVGRLIELADEWAEKCNQARKHTDAKPICGKHIPIKVDDLGIGSGVTCRLRELGYNVYPVSASENAFKTNRYRNKRSELWFMTRDRAKEGHLHLGLLHPKVIADLRKQAMAPLWELQSDGRREVEKKEATEARLGCSPDFMDGMNLSYYSIEMRTAEVMQIETPGYLERAKERVDERKMAWRGNREGRRGLFGGRR